MLQSISPYALLRQSIPQQKAQTITDYDRFSLAHTQDSVPIISPPSAGLPMEKTVGPAGRQSTPTHYIADIHTRHTKAMRHAPQNPSQL